MLFAVVIVFGGCASTTPKLIRATPPGNLQLSEVRKDFSAHQDSQVRWGGSIISVANEEDETIVYVLDRSLGKFGRPKRDSGSSGRFAFHRKEFLDPALYEKGSDITVFGRLVAEQDEKIGNKTVKIPVVDAEVTHLWPDNSNADCGYRYPYGGHFYPYGFRRGYYDPFYYRYW